MQRNQSYGRGPIEQEILRIIQAKRETDCGFGWSASPSFGAHPPKRRRRHAWYVVRLKNVIHGIDFPLVRLLVALEIMSDSRVKDLVSTLDVIRVRVLWGSHSGRLMFYSTDSCNGEEDSERKLICEQFG